MNATDGNGWRRFAEVARVFTPGAPVERPALFTGRDEQTRDMINGVASPGQHVVVYGERGVGKTSLTNIVASIFATQLDTSLHCIRIACSTDDSYEDIWRRFFRILDVTEADLRTPEDVVLALGRVEHEVLLVIDDVEQIGTTESAGNTLSLLSETIRRLSGNHSSATLALVGVADDLGELVPDQRLIGREIVQIRVPRMPDDDLVEVIDRGCAELEMSVSERTKSRVGRLSSGLPHYTHLLCLHAAQRAVTESRKKITAKDVDVAIRLAVGRSQPGITTEYLHATRSAHTDNLFPQVLLACALAEKDELGFFPASAVRSPLSQIMGKPYDIPSYARHLRQFSSETRGNVLQKSGRARRHRYRFANPLWQPHILLSSLSSSLVSPEFLDELIGRREGEGYASSSSG